jgi:hypothetical protein
VYSVLIPKGLISRLVVVLSVENMNPDNVT